MTTTNQPEQENQEQPLDTGIIARIEELDQQLNQNAAQRKSILMELHLIAVEAMGIPQEERNFSPYQDKYIYESECQCGCPSNCVDCGNTIFALDLDENPKQYVLLHGLKEIQEWMDRFFTEYMQNACACRMSISPDGLITCGCSQGTNPTTQAKTKEVAALEHQTLQKIREAGLTTPTTENKPVILHYSDAAAQRDTDLTAETPQLEEKRPAPRDRDRDFRQKVNETLQAQGPMTTEELINATGYPGESLNLETNLGRWPETNQDEERRWTLENQENRGQAEQIEEDQEPTRPSPTGEEPTPVSQPEEEETPTTSRRVPPSSTIDNTPEGIRQAIAQILGQSYTNQPMPERTLYSRLLDKGFPTGDEQPIHQFLAHLTDDPRFRESPKGHWTVQKEDLPE